MVVRPQRVTPSLTKGESQKVICQCGHQFEVPADTFSAQCPACHQTLDWGLRK